MATAFAEVARKIEEATKNVESALAELRPGREKEFMDRVELFLKRFAEYCVRKGGDLKIKTIGSSIWLWCTLPSPTSVRVSVTREFEESVDRVRVVLDRGLVELPVDKLADVGVYVRDDVAARNLENYSCEYETSTRFVAEDVRKISLVIKLGKDRVEWLNIRLGV